MALRWRIAYFLFAAGIFASWCELVFSAHPCDPELSLHFRLSDIIFDWIGMTSSFFMLNWYLVFRKSETVFARVAIAFVLVWFVTGILTPAT
jgi:membrane associated rhomboid family serine protease